MSSNRRFARFAGENSPLTEQPAQANSLQQADVDIFGGEVPQRRSRVPENALMQLEDGSIQQGKFILTRIGLMLTDELTKPEWEHVGSLLQQLDGAIQWLLGDYLAYSERVWKKTYDQFAAEWGRAPKTLRNYVWVASSVDMSLRKDTLDFSHHNLVAGMQPAEQDFYLTWAVENNASVFKLDQKIKADKGDPAPLEPIAPEATRKAFGRLSTMTEIVKDDPITVRRIMKDLDQIEELIAHFRQFYPKR